MAQRKKNLYYLLIAVVIYAVIYYVYNNILLPKGEVVTYCLLREVKRGEKLTKDDLQTLTIKNINESIKKQAIVKKSSIEEVLNNKVIKGDYSQGQILFSDMLIDSKEYIKAEEKMEIVAINISTPEDFVSYKVQKGSIVNIYYFGKAKQAESILKNLNKNISVSGNNLDSVISSKILENVKVLEVLDKYGRVIDYSDKSVSGEKIVPSSILIEVDSDKVMSLNNLKSYGKFSLAILS